MSSIAILSLASTVFTSAQAQPDAAIKRRVLSQTPAVYPSLARTLALEGVVRLEVLVNVDGVATKVDVKGGHPVLAQAAATAVGHWRWEKAPRESRETVEVKFNRE
jgi:TonB family protein